MSTTDLYIKALTNLKDGDLGLLRTHAGMGLDESTEAFDLFAGLWWPLRQKSPKTPRREVAWMIAKLYAGCPIPHSQGDTFASQLRQCQPIERIQKKFDELLTLPLNNIEPILQHLLREIASKTNKLDWVKLTDHLSIWERESKLLEWAKEFLGINSNFISNKEN